MKPFPHIVGFTGRLQHGKSTSARMLVATYPDFNRVSFADPIRAMLRQLGLQTEDFGERKETPHEALGGKTPRFAMQTLGTEWGRQIIWDDIWVEAALRKAREVAQFGERTVFDDVRFDNEARAIRNAGGVIVRVVRPGFGQQSNHPSEAGVSDCFVDAEFIAQDTEALRVHLLTYFNSFGPY